MMTTIVRRILSAIARTIIASLAPMTIAIIATVETSTWEQRFGAACAVTLVATLWAAVEHTKAEAAADKAMAAFAVDTLRRLTSGECTSLDVTITHRRSDGPTKAISPEA